MLAIALSIICALAPVLASWTYQNLEVINWEWQSSVVVDDYLYIEGGQLYALENGTANMYFLGQTISADLSQSWTNATFGDHNFQTQRPTDDAHWTKRPALFYNPVKSQVNQWGGWPLLNTTPAQLWTFQPSSNGRVNWLEETTPITNSAGDSSPALAGAAMVATDTAFYSLGGNLPQAYFDPYIAVQGFLKFDYKPNTWQNLSSLSATSSGFFVGGEAAYARNFGNSGFLVFIGGIIPDTQVFSVDGTHLADMSVITLYDIENDKWYHQKATGDIPPPRQFFCSAGVTSRENSFEIFILGGSTNSTWDLSYPDDAGYRSVYVLSLPAFRWFQSPDSSHVRRAEHSCQVIGNRQMLVIGGSFPSDPAGIAAKDPWPNGLGVFDMTAFAWSDVYNATAETYSQPDVIWNYYTSSYRTPEWNDPALAAAFAFSPSDATATATRTTSTSTSNPTSTNTSTPAPKSTNLGAIIGGAVGGAVALLAALIIAFICVRRRRRSKAAAGLPKNDTASPPNTFSGEKDTAVAVRPASSPMTPELPGQSAFYAPHAELAAAERSPYTLPAEFPDNTAVYTGTGPHSGGAASNVARNSGMSGGSGSGPGWSHDNSRSGQASELSTSASTAGRGVRRKPLPAELDGLSVPMTDRR